jgi:hypothetical protein
MNAALVPRSVIATFPEQSRLRVTPLPDGQNLIRAFMGWSKRIRSAKIERLRGVLEVV